MRAPYADSGAGVILGIAAALVLTRGLRHLLFGVAPADPVAFGTVAGLMLAVALLAAYVPARRAARIDPVTALREES